MNPSLEPHNPYPQHTGFFSPLVDGWRARMVAKHISPNASVLDLGCGPAILLKHLRQPDLYVGIDGDAQVIQANQSRYRVYSFICSPIEQAVRSIFRKFNAIVLAAVLEHLEKPERVLEGARERLLPQGRLYLTTPTPLGGKFHFWTAQAGLLSREACEDHKAFFDRPSLAALLDRSGWSMDHYSTFEFGMNQIAIATPKGL